MYKAALGIEEVPDVPFVRLMVSTHENRTIVARVEPGTNYFLIFCAGSIFALIDF